MHESVAVIRTFCVNYCDDIRHEMGNKLSLIGVYGADLVVPELPTAIAKLCVFAQLYSEVDAEFESEIEIHVMVDDEVIATSTTVPRHSKDLEASQFQKLGAQFVLTPFFIEKECTLRVRAIYQGTEYQAAALKIRASPHGATTLDAPATT